MSPDDVKVAMQNLNAEDPSDLTEVTYLDKRYYLLRQSSLGVRGHSLLEYLFANPSYVHSPWTKNQSERTWYAL